ncbi:DUF1552 domain-containing protein [Aureliella helgolandensis]|uniref:DUF1552 domain-containing protein n=1 Tax=Aureliella helgolandensis TaxID=2527968 RepID=A0A518GH20_9BACT|nr:DUF1552 domain-containing protein [Aureliella helgolandensis]QDV27895.1 hypothetical protein Q31a_62880 [Aureliella helgolandensis]
MSYQKPFRLSRRTLLRGAGAAVGLPYLQAMLPGRDAVGAEVSSAPARMGMFYFGTGMNMRQFTPQDEGEDFTASRILKPLEPMRGKFTVLSGTYLAEGGGHEGAYPFSTSIARGEKQQISPDQVAAKVIGKETRFSSMQLSVDRGTNYGSQALATISWNEQGVPLAAENDPTAMFDRLFRPNSPEQTAAEVGGLNRRRSVLDLVRSDAKQVNARLGQADRQQLDQYFTSLRELEQQLERRIAWADRPKSEPKLDGLHGRFEQPMKGPEGNGEYLYDDYAKMMYDLIVLAFQTDSTRVVSYVVRKELSGGVYPEFNVSNGYHALSHHGNDPRNLDELAKVDAIYMTHWAYFLKRLSEVKEGEGSLLDHTVLGLSSGMGFEHSRDNLPTILSGGQGLGVRHRGHLRLDTEQPLASVWQTMLERVGVPVGGEFQDSRGVIAELVQA